MALPQEVAQEIYQVIQGGAELGPPAQIIQFPSDNGQNVFKVVQKTYHGSNGTGFNYWVAAAVAVIEGVRTAVSAGAAYLAMEVGTFGAMVAPALGMTTGYAMYNLNPIFWQNVADRLMAAGQTVNGKVITYLDENGIISFHPDAIEILKNALIQEGIFDYNFEAPEYADTGDVTVQNFMNGYALLRYYEGHLPYGVAYDVNVRENILRICAEHQDDLAILTYDHQTGEFQGWSPLTISFIPYTDIITLGTLTACTVMETYGERLLLDTIMTLTDVRTTIGSINPFVGVQIRTTDTSVSGINAEGGYEHDDALQDGAHYPDTRYFPDLYPDWHPEEFPEQGGEELPSTYPIEYPDNLPEEEPYQDPAQDPDPDHPNHDDEFIETITDDDNDPFRNEDENNWYEEETDEDEQVDDDDQDDVDEGEDVDTGEDPVDPDPVIPPSPIIPDPPTPDTVNSSKLFTVYNPSLANLNALGAYLWDNDLMDLLKKIWQNPLDGIISLIQVYVTPTTSGNHNIILGYLDSGVSAPVVSNQFVTVDCGSVAIPEQNQNCTDYIPYTSLSLYLPFIGITEIDTNEFMGGSISVKYKVDVYTGTCLAEVKCTRTKDLKNGAVLYTYSGNCSQQIPLTSGDARGVLSALISAAGAGLSIASGGSIGLMAGMGAVNAAMGREMLHVGHSGNLSANAGIMGQKKPYLILNRRRPYNANSYNDFYGYPANKTVYLNNYKGLGFVRVKSCHLNSPATQNEKTEIMSLLTSGVIL